MNTDIYYEVHGSGSALLLIPGGNGDAGFYEPLAKALAGEFTVVTYDRQGFSRSPLSAATDDRLASDIEDARRLLDSHSDGPAEVFGSSSGGIVALDLVCRLPDIVRTVVVHEPPVVCLLPTGRAPARRCGSSPRTRALARRASAVRSSVGCCA
jgi:pimeloyl-ACP methyl ester carboxylesterase